MRMLLLLIALFPAAAFAEDAPASPAHEPVVCQHDWDPSQADQFCKTLQPVAKWSEAQLSARDCVPYYQALLKSLKDACQFKKDIAALQDKINAKAASIDSNNRMTLTGAADVYKEAYQFAHDRGKIFKDDSAALDKTHGAFHEDLRKFKLAAGAQLKTEFNSCGKAGTPPAHVFFTAASLTQVDADSNYSRIHQVLDKLQEHANKMNLTLSSMAHRADGRGGDLGNPDIDHTRDGSKVDELLKKAQTSAMEQGAGKAVLAGTAKIAGRVAGDDAASTVGRIGGPALAAVIDFGEHLSRHEADFVGLVAIGVKALLGVAAGAAGETLFPEYSPFPAIAANAAVGYAVDMAEKSIRKAMASAEIKNFQIMAQLSNQYPSADSAQLSQQLHIQLQDGLCGAPMSDEFRRAQTPAEQDPDFAKKLQQRSRGGH